MTLKVAIVGTGKVAAQNYLPYLVQRQDLALSYYNRSRDKAAAVAQQFGGRVAQSLPDLLADEPDTVLVLTRETDRYAVTDELLTLRPRRLFFEKPLVAQLGQADVTEDDFGKGRSLLTRAHAAGIETAMVFNYRFFEQTQKARELIAAHNFGQPVHFTGLVHYACWSHCIDLVLSFMGPAATITALAAPFARPCMGTENVRDVTAAVQMVNGATGTIIGTCSIDFKLPLYELTVAFERGRLTLRDLDGDLELIDYASERHTVHALSRSVSRWDQYRASFGKAINAYLDAVQTGAPPPVPGLAGLQELQFEAALKRSIAQSRPVVVTEEFPISISS
ncbi:MAG: gfo/Idh/MocA family oxidoreductase [Caldilinea sp. CFX5]|nr:gfo/Idh/MocA family oxidoreductase [Caldilinea sp. CFX5]